MALGRYRLLILALALGQFAPAMAAPTSHKRAVDPGQAEAERALAYNLPAAGILTEHDLVQFALKKLYYRPADKFSASSFDDAIAIGRKFSFTLPVAEGIFSSPAGWDYDIGSQSLKLEYHLSSWSGLDFIVSEHPTDFYSAVGLPTALQLWIESDKPEKSVGENAFGAHVVITKFYSKTVNVGVFAQGGGSIFGERQALSRELHLAPEAGRIDVRGMTVVVEGVIAPAPDGHTVYCGGRVKEPTMDSPTDDFSQNCVISANVTRVAFVSPAAGVMAEWTAQSEVAH